MTTTIEGKAQEKQQKSLGRALPDGWRWVKLGEVSKLQSGYAFKSKWFTTEGIRLLRNANVTPGKIDWGDAVYLPAESASEFQAYKLDVGDIVLSLDRPIISSGLKVSRLSQEDIPSLLLQRVGRFQPSNSLTSDYLYFFLNSRLFVDSITGHDQSIGVPHISPKQVEDVRLPLPPIAEQKRIVGILSDRLTTIDKARLATQIQLEAAQALPASYLRQIFDSPEAQTWEKKSIGNIADVTGGIQKTPSRKPYSFHKPYLTVRNVQRGYLDLSDIERFELTPKELNQYRLQKGDILIVEGNGSVGHIGRNAIYHGEFEDCVHQNHIIRVRLDASLNDSAFISLYLNSDLGKSQMLELAETTSGLYTLSVSKVNRLTVSLPTLSKQVAVVETLRSKISHSQDVSQSLQDQLNTITALPPALLRQAFNGEL